MVNRLEDQRVDVLGLVILEGDLHLLICISKSLNTDADGSVPHVGILRFREWVVVAVDDSIEVSGHTLRHLVEELVIELLRVLVSELCQRD